MDFNLDPLDVCSSAGLSPADYGASDAVNYGPDSVNSHMASCDLDFLLSDAADDADFPFPSAGSPHPNFASYSFDTTPRNIPHNLPTVITAPPSSSRPPSIKLESLPLNNTPITPQVLHVRRAPPAYPAMKSEPMSATLLCSLDSEASGLDEAGSSRSRVEVARMARAAALDRYRRKRAQRCFKKKVRYECRKKIASSRPRVSGRFAKKVVGEAAGLQKAVSYASGLSEMGE